MAPKDTGLAVDFPTMGNARGTLRAGIVLLLLVLGGPASAKFRVTRVLDWQSGLPESFTGNVEQDPEGFLWVGTSAGGFRYDGSEMVEKFPLGLGMVASGLACVVMIGYLMLSKGEALAQSLKDLLRL